MVLSVSADPEMVGPDAARSVACVANLFAIRDWAIGKFPSSPVSVLPTIEPEPAIARTFGTEPQPAFARLVNLSPKGFIPVGDWACVSALR